jgi:hypothetical protein
MVSLETVRGRKNIAVLSQSQSTQNNISAGNDMSSASSGWEPRPAYSPLLDASERKVLGACRLQARKACD